MKTVLVIDPGEASGTTTVRFLGLEFVLRRAGCGGSPERAATLVREAAGIVDAVALDGVPCSLQLGSARARHDAGRAVAREAAGAAVLDGGGIRAGLERWALALIDRAQPGMTARRRVLMVPGLNHGGLAHALETRGSRLRYADPTVFFGLPRLPGVGSPTTLEKVARSTLQALGAAPMARLLPAPTPRLARRARPLFEWAEVLAGDVGFIRAHGPDRLPGRTALVETAGQEDLEDLRFRGVATVAMLTPALESEAGPLPASAAVLEALLACVCAERGVRRSEDAYLDLVAELSWSPDIVDLQPDSAGVHRFAFVIHPLDVGSIRRHPRFRWTRFLPDALVERVAAHLPPLYVSRIRGGRSPSTGRRIEGHLIALGATPREMMRRGPEFTYARLERAARMAAARGARLMGLGAFTSVVGDAGVTVSRNSPIAITSGNSLTVAATLEAAKQAAIRMGIRDLTRGRAMVIGATGSIGSVCARMLAQAIRDVVLVSIEPEKLIELKRLIVRETPGARVTVATRSSGLVEDCDLIVTATSAFGQRILDIGRCKPGAIICDVARPPDIGPEEAALRPDVLVIESGEVLIPGDVDFGYDIGLPPKVSYACLAETALLAMEGRFESYTLGRDIRIDKVKEIYALFGKHGFRLAGLRSLGRYLDDDALLEKRDLAERLRHDPALLERARREASERLAALEIGAKGIRVRREPVRSAARRWLTGGIDAVALWLGRARV